MTTLWGMRYALAVLILAGCSESGSQSSESEAETTQTTAANAAVAVKESAVDEPPETKPEQLEPLPELVDVPPLDLKPVDDKAAAKARALAKRARELNRAGDHAAAADEYIAALKADPGHIMARYNLSCAYNMAGDTGRGLAVLKQFKDDGCPLCLGRLVRARADAEWKSSHEDPRFVQLTSDVVVRTPDLQAVASTFRNEARARKLDEFSTYVHPRAPVKIEEQYYECMQQGENCSVAHTDRAAVRGTAELNRWLRQRAKYARANEVRLVVQKRIGCSDKCCSFGKDREPGDIPDNLEITHVCFEKDSGGVTTLSSVTLAKYEWGGP